MLEQLQRLGFTKKEAQIYRELARKGELSANKVAKNISCQRTVAYNILQQLVEKGHVSYITSNKIRMFSISDSNSLLSELKEKESIAKELMTELKKITPEKETKQKIQTFEGQDAMRVIHEEIRNAKNLRILNATGLVYEYLKYSAKHIITDIENKSNAKIIGTQAMKKTELAKAKNINIKYLPKEAENCATTFIFEEKVIIQILKDKPFLIKIENKDIYDGYKKDFDVLWTLLKH
ncbi:MAG: TrmB family transcriptional regulator [Candidatus Nanoarchaeia archaeon]